MTRDQAALAEALRKRAAALSRFEDWEQAHPPVLSPENAVAGIGALYEILPPESRARGVSGAGVAALHRALRELGAGLR